MDTFSSHRGRPSNDLYLPGQNAVSCRVRGGGGKEREREKERKVAAD